MNSLKQKFRSFILGAEVEVSYTRKETQEESKEIEEMPNKMNNRL